MRVVYNRIHNLPMLVDTMANVSMFSLAAEANQSWNCNRANRLKHSYLCMLQNGICLPAFSHKNMYPQSHILPQTGGNLKLEQTGKSWVRKKRKSWENISEMFMIEYSMSWKTCHPRCYLYQGISVWIVYFNSFVHIKDRNCCTIFHWKVNILMWIFVTANYDIICNC